MGKINFRTVAVGLIIFASVRVNAAMPAFEVKPEKSKSINPAEVTSKKSLIIADGGELAPSEFTQVRKWLDNFKNIDKGINTDFFDFDPRFSNVVVRCVYIKNPANAPIKACVFRSKKEMFAAMALTYRTIGGLKTGLTFGPRIKFPSKTEFEKLKNRVISFVLKHNSKVDPALPRKEKFKQMIHYNLDIIKKVLTSEEIKIMQKFQLGVYLNTMDAHHISGRVFERAISHNRGGQKLLREENLKNNPRALAIYKLSENFFTQLLSSMKSDNKKAGRKETDGYLIITYDQGPLTPQVLFSEFLYALMIAPQSPQKFVRAPIEFLRKNSRKSMREKEHYFRVFYPFARFCSNGFGSCRLLYDRYEIALALNPNITSFLNNRTPEHKTLLPFIEEYGPMLRNFYDKNFAGAPYDRFKLIFNW